MMEPTSDETLDSWLRRTPPDEWKGKVFRRLSDGLMMRPSAVGADSVYGRFFAIDSTAPASCYEPLAVDREVVGSLRISKGARLVNEPAIEWTRLRGRYIAIEGVDGAGTTTMTKRLVDHMRWIGASVAVVNEPGCKASALIRKLLAQPKLEDSERTALALLFAADRLLARDSIDRALASGTTVISDRCYLSSLAYQTSEALPRAWVSSIQRNVLLPDKIIYLRVSPETALRRIDSRGGERDLFETERELASHVKAYDELAADPGYGRGIVTIDAEDSEGEVFAALLQALPEICPV